MTRRGLSVAVLTLCVAASVKAVSAQPAPPAAGPWIGVWKLNAAKSAAANGQPAPAVPVDTIFRMVAVRTDVFKYTIESARTDGSAPSVRAELIGRFDGKDYIEIGNPGADTNRFRIIDRQTYEVVDTKDGKDLLTIRITISDDGQTRTSVARGINVRGEPVNRTSVYDRVRE